MYVIVSLQVHMLVYVIQKNECIMSYLVQNSKNMCASTLVTTYYIAILFTGISGQNLDLCTKITTHTHTHTHTHIYIHIQTIYIYIYIYIVVINHWWERLVFGKKILDCYQLILISFLPMSNWKFPTSWYQDKHHIFCPNKKIK